MNGYVVTIVGEWWDGTLTNTDPDNAHVGADQSASTAEAEADH